MNSETNGNSGSFPTRQVTTGPFLDTVGSSAPPCVPMSAPSGEELIGDLIMEGLPPANTKRWVVRRKAAVIAAVRGGGITIEEACRAYQLSEEELRAWERAFETHGLAGLRTTRTQQYRGARHARAALWRR